MAVRDPQDSAGDPLMAAVRLTRLVVVGHGSRARELESGTVVNLDAETACIWCLKEWAVPVDATQPERPSSTSSRPEALPPLAGRGPAERPPVLA